MHSWYKIKELDCDCSFVLQSLFGFFPSFIDDWKCDQYRWINNKVAKPPSKNPFLRNTYFVSDFPNGPCPDFRKHAYEMLPFNGLVLFHYLGDEKSYVSFPIQIEKQRPSICMYMPFNCWKAKDQLPDSHYKTSISENCHDWSCTLLLASIWT